MHMNNRKHKHVFIWFYFFTFILKHALLNVSKACMKWSIGRTLVCWCQLMPMVGTYEEKFHLLISAAGARQKRYYRRQWQMDHQNITYTMTIKASDYYRRQQQTDNQTVTVNRVDSADKIRKKIKTDTWPEKEKKRRRKSRQLPLSQLTFLSFSDPSVSRTPLLCMWL